MSIVSTIVNVGVGVVTTKLLGIAGPLLGTLAATVLVNIFWLPRLLKRELGVAPTLLIRALISPAAAFIAFAAIESLIFRRVNAHGWIALIAWLCVFASINGTVIWCGILSHSQRDLLRLRLAHVLLRLRLSRGRP